MLQCARLPKMLAVLAAIAVATTGCTEYWTSTVSRKNSMKTGDVLLTTADLRQTVRSSTPGSAITCAEPSPDVAKIAAASLDTSASGSASSIGNAVSPELAFTLAMTRSEALAQLGQRLATIQLLRDGMFRACEAFANGAIDQVAYSAILSRYDKVMVTMLLGEFAANSTTRLPPVVLTSSSQANGSATVTPQQVTAQANAGAPTTPAGAPSTAQTGAEQPAAGQPPTGGAAGGGANAAPPTGNAATPPPPSASTASSSVTTTTQAPAGTTIQEAASDRPAIAAALASMQQAYLDDVNLDPLMISCLETESTTTLAKVCEQLAKDPSAILAPIIQAKLLGTLLRAMPADQPMTLEERMKAIDEFASQLKKLTAETAAGMPASPTPIGQN